MTVGLQQKRYSIKKNLFIKIQVYFKYEKTIGVALWDWLELPKYL